MGVSAMSNPIRRLVASFSVAAIWLLLCVLHLSSSIAKKDNSPFSFYSLLAIAWVIVWLLYLHSCVRVFRIGWLWFFSILLLLAVFLWALLDSHPWIALIALGVAIVDQVVIFIVVRRSGLNPQIPNRWTNPTA